MQYSLIVVIPLVTVCAFVACVLWLDQRNEECFKKFAAGEGLIYQRRGAAPITVPYVVYGRRTITEWYRFLYGKWRGIEVFAADFQIGRGRGGAELLFMVAVRADLQAIGDLDTRRWKLTPLNGWTFLIPREPKSDTLSIGKATALWDMLTTATRAT